MDRVAGRRVSIVYFNGPVVIGGVRPEVNAKGPDALSQRFELGSKARYAVILASVVAGAVTAGVLVLAISASRTRQA